MIAALPMYEGARTRDAHDRYWALIRQHYPGKAPQHLTRCADPWALWQSPDLLFAQTCGLPFRAKLKDTLTLVGTPDFAVDGCPPGYYRSVVLRRRGDRTGHRLAVNDPLSQSGWAAACDWAAATGSTFSGFVLTGSHAASAKAVADGDADIACVDAVSWRLLLAEQPGLGGVEVVDQTAPTPGLPYVTAQPRQADALAEAVTQAIDALTGPDRDALGLRGLIRIPREDYLAIPLPPPVPAAAAELP